MKNKKLSPPKLQSIHLQTKPGMDQRERRLLDGLQEAYRLQQWRYVRGRWGEKAAGPAGANRLIMRKSAAGKTATTEKKRKCRKINEEECQTRKVQGQV